LLESYLVPYLFEKNHRPKLEKRGNKVSLIKTRDCIIFRDITKLLAPSTNLRSFGKLFNFEVDKGFFCHGYFDSVKKLADRQLPPNIEAWASDLTGPSVTIADMESAHALYAQAGCETLGDYLKTYLKLDVIILYKASQEWRKKLKSLIHVDFVESRKFTISSMANLANGKSLVSRQEIGNFFPNNSQIYRLLREGMRG
jgi:hypothetical protein